MTTGSTLALSPSGTLATPSLLWATDLATMHRWMDGSHKGSFLAFPGLFVLVGAAGKHITVNPLHLVICFCSCSYFVKEESELGHFMLAEDEASLSVCVTLQQIGAGR